MIDGDFFLLTLLGALRADEVENEAAAGPGWHVRQEAERGNVPSRRHDDVVAAMTCELKLGQGRIDGWQKVMDLEQALRKFSAVRCRAPDTFFGFPQHVTFKLLMIFCNFWHPRRRVASARSICFTICRSLVGSFPCNYHTSTMSDQPHRRFNPLQRTWVLCSPHRAQRPWQGQVEAASVEQLPHYDPSCQ